jgi:GNAT superfamily N-acetyltransferase
LGGAAVALDAAAIDPSDLRELAVLWDIRVSPKSRGRGIGTQLFRAVTAWVRGRGGTRLEIETQDTNVPACRFYARQGCVLGSI